MLWSAFSTGLNEAVLLSVPGRQPIQGKPPARPPVRGFDVTCRR